MRARIGESENDPQRVGAYDILPVNRMCTPVSQGSSVSHKYFGGPLDIRNLQGLKSPAVKTYTASRMCAGLHVRLFLLEAVPLSTAARCCNMVSKTERGPFTGACLVYWSMPGNVRKINSVSHRETKASTIVPRITRAHTMVPDKEMRKPNFHQETTIWWH